MEEKRNTCLVTVDLGYGAPKEDIVFNFFDFRRFAHCYHPVIRCDNNIDTIEDTVICQRLEEVVENLIHLFHRGFDLEREVVVILGRHKSGLF